LTRCHSDLPPVRVNASTAVCPIPPPPNPQPPTTNHHPSHHPRSHVVASPSHPPAVAPSSFGGRVGFIVLASCLTQVPERGPGPYSPGGLGGLWCMGLTGGPSLGLPRHLGCAWTEGRGLGLAGTRGCWTRAGGCIWVCICVWTGEWAPTGDMPMGDIGASGGGAVVIAGISDADKLLTSPPREKLKTVRKLAPLRLSAKQKTHTHKGTGSKSNPVPASLPRVRDDLSNRSRAHVKTSQGLTYILFTILCLRLGRGIFSLSFFLSFFLYFLLCKARNK
jgi:hypothetical protein